MKMFDRIYADWRRLQWTGRIQMSLDPVFTKEMLKDRKGDVKHPPSNILFGVSVCDPAVFPKLLIAEESMGRPALKVRNSAFLLRDFPPLF